MLRKEIYLSRVLDHPNIVRIHQVLEDEDKIYLIMDDIKGQSLFFYLYYH